MLYFCLYHMIESGPLVEKLSLFRQFLISLMLGLMFMLITRLSEMGGGAEFGAGFSGILFYTVMSSFLSVFHDSFVKYTLRSYGWYLLLAIILLLSARLLSGLSIWTLPEYRAMFLAVSIFYFITSLAARIIRAVYHFAETSL